MKSATMKLALCVVSVWLGLCTSALAAQSGDEQLRAAVERLLGGWRSSDGPGAVIVVSTPGTTPFTYSFGLADLEQNAAISAHTRFHIASTSKQFTAFALLLLADEGRLSLDDEVRRFVPELHDFGVKLTLRHLLTHTSGLRDQWDLLSMAGWRDEDDLTTQDDVLRMLFRQRELNFAPGSRFLYCNSGYTLLALVIERVSGQSLADFLASHIFVPLDMSETRLVDDVHSIVPGRANSYVPVAGGRFERRLLSYSVAGPTGVLTTAADMAKWMDNFSTRKLGSWSVHAQFVRRTTPVEDPSLGYAAGLFVRTAFGQSIVGHGGADAGYRTFQAIVLGKSMAIAVLSNRPDLPIDRLGNELLAYAVGAKDIGDLEPITVPQHDAQVIAASSPLASATGYEGCYISHELESVYCLEARAGILSVDHVRQGRLELRPTGNVDRFTTAAPWLATLSFERDEHGNVVSFRASSERALGVLFQRSAVLSESVKPIGPCACRRGYSAQ